MAIFLFKFKKKVKAHQTLTKFYNLIKCPLNSKMCAISTAFPTSRLRIARAFYADRKLANEQIRMIQIVCAF